VTFYLHADSDDANDLLSRLLPKATSVLDVCTAAVLHMFVGATSTDWRGWRDTLTPSQTRELESTRLVERRPTIGADTTIVLTDEDRAWIDQLTQDGRRPFTTLARITGSTPGRVTRRIESLLYEGIVYFDVDLAPAALGRQMLTTLWLSVEPQHLISVGQVMAVHIDVPFAAAVTGTSNLTAILVTNDLVGVYEFVTSTLARLTGITAYEIVPLTRYAKHVDALIVGDRLAPPGYANIKPRPRPSNRRQRH
jgi:DNA-binding Lrp family transcriptional regulator